jgi:hypothetical protein
MRLLVLVRWNHFSKGWSRQAPRRSRASVPFGNRVHLFSRGRSQVRFLVYQGMASAGFSHAVRDALFCPGFSPCSASSIG